MKSIVLIICIALAGCGVELVDTAATRYKCSPEQWAKAVKEAKESEEAAPNEKYRDYWLNAAIMRNCEKKGGA